MSNGLTEIIRNVEQLGAPGTIAEVTHPPLVGIAAGLTKWES
jgi:hypothetical protein